MSESTFTLRVDDNLKIAFVDAAKQHGRSAAQMIREYMRAVVQETREKTEYEAWYAAMVQKGLDDVNAGDTVPHEVVIADSTVQKAALLARIRGER